MKLVGLLTLSGHAYGEALFETTVLTAVTREWRNVTLLVIGTFVCHSLSYTPPEETLQIKQYIVSESKRIVCVCVCVYVCVCVCVCVCGVCVVCVCVVCVCDV